MALFDIFRRNKDGADQATRRVPVIEPAPEDHDRYMNLAVAAHNSDVRFRITAAILAVSVGFNGFYMFQAKYVPVVVAVDNIGQKVFVGAVTDSKPVDVERVIRREVAEFIEFTRSVVGDNALQKKRMMQAANRMPKGSVAEKVVNQLYTERPPFKVAETSSITIELKVLLRQSPESFHAEWIETTRSLSGDIQGSPIRWKAVVNYKLIPQNRADTIENNPIGFFVQDLSWSPMK